MIKTILLIAETVIVINIVYVLLPNGSFEKYSKHILGLMLILIFAGTIMKVDISSEVLNFDSDVPIYNSDNIKNAVETQTEKVISDKIASKILEENIKVDTVEVTYSNGAITGVNIVANSNVNRDKIINIVANYCGIGKNMVTVK